MKMPAPKDFKEKADPIEAGGCGASAALRLAFMHVSDPNPPQAAIMKSGRETIGS